MLYNSVASCSRISSLALCVWLHFGVCLKWLLACLLCTSFRQPSATITHDRSTHAQERTHADPFTCNVCVCRKSESSWLTMAWHKLKIKPADSILPNQVAATDVNFFRNNVFAFSLCGFLSLGRQWQPGHSRKTNERPHASIEWKFREGLRTSAGLLWDPARGWAEPNPLLELMLCTRIAQRTDDSTICDTLLNHSKEPSSQRMWNY